MTSALTTSRLQTFGDDAHIASWAVMTTAIAGDPLELVGSADRSVQVAGTFNGATVVLEGSNDGTNYVTLKDVFGNAISLTAAGLRQVAEITRYVRPSASGGGGSQSVTVTMLARRA